MTAINYKNWSHMDVVNWLISLHFGHLVPNFEQMQIDGAKLAILSDQDLRQKLRICKPSELLDLKEAIRKLKGDEFSTALERQTKYSKSMCASQKSVLKKRSKSLTLTGAVSHEMSHFSITSDVSPRHPKNIQGSDSKYLELIDNTKLVAWSASELIDTCIYSGWIRKKGSKKNYWKKRFLVLRLGCLYYFKNEVAPSPKGSINLSGYKAKICIEDNVMSKCLYTLKLIHTNPQVRTYYFSFGSRKELEGWKEAIDSEIMSISPSESVIYESPKCLGDDDDSDDDSFTNIDESYLLTLGREVKPTIPSRSALSLQSMSSASIPSNLGNVKPTIPSRSALSLQSMSSASIPSNLGNVKPTIPSRSALPLQSMSSTSIPSNLGNVKPKIPSRISHSLQRMYTVPFIPSKSSLPSYLPTTLKNLGNEATYLATVDEKIASNPVAAQPGLSKSPVQPPSSQTPSSDLLDQDFFENNDIEESEGEDEDDGGDFFMFRRREELIPPSCIFDQLERVEAEKLLNEAGMNGMYLIRGGSHARAEKVLSVWHEGRCWHYRLFKNKNSLYSLNPNQVFRTITELLQYYTFQQKLPHLDLSLENPYCPSQN